MSEASDPSARPRARGASGENGGAVDPASASAAGAAAPGLPNAQRRFVLLFEHAPVGLALSDAAEERYLDANESYCRLLGFRREELIGRRLCELGLCDDPADQARLAEALHRDGRLQNFEISGRNRDGRRIVCLLSAEPIEFDGRRCLVSTLHDITDQRRTEQALHESEALYRTLVEYSPEAIVLHRRGRIEFANRAAVQLVRASEPGQLSGRSPLDFVHPDTRALAADRIRSVLEGAPAAPRTRLRLQCLDGSSVMAESVSVAVTLNGERGVLVLLRDLTPHLEAERALRLSEEKFSKAFRSSPDAISISRFDDGVFIDVNEGFLELSGYTREEVIGRSSRELSFWEDWAMREELVARLQRDGVIRDVELLFRMKSGALRPCWVAAELAEIGGLRCVVATVRDLTRRKQAEAALRESEERYRVVAEQTGQLVYDYDIASGRIKWAGACAQLTGFSAPEMASVDRRGWEAMIHPDDRAQGASLLETARRTDAPYRARYRLQRRDGVYLVVEDRGVFLRDAAGARSRMLGSVNDVTERERLEGEVRHSQKMESVGLLAGGVAHDFNNVLTVIHGHASLLELRDDLPAEVRAALAQIGQAAEFASALTKQLLAFSRRQVLQPGPLRLGEVVEGMSGLLRRALGEDIQLAVAVEPDAPVVHADRGMLEQVLLNLAVNARDAMPDGGHLAIRVREAEPATAARGRALGSGTGRVRFACIEVADTGIGIPAEVLPRIFDPFFTTKPAGKGTGLGLATVYGIVEQHRGWVDVESAPGHGALFRVWLPAMEGGPVVTAAAAPPAASAPSRVATAQPEQRQRILLVEDEEAVRTLMQAVLERQSYEVTIAASGAAALAWWDRNSPAIDLLITDVIMPEGVSGRELADRLRRRQPGLQVVFISGYSADALGRVDAAQGEYFIQKPFELAVFLGTVREALTRPGLENRR